MPSVIKEHKFGRMSKPAQYDQYLDGRIYKFTKDELKEFSDGAATVRSGMYSAAVRAVPTMRVRSQIVEDELIIQAYLKEE